MSYTRIEATPAYVAQPRVLPQLERIGRVVLWAVVNAILVFAEHAAELAAPLLLLGGAIWWAIPHALLAITLEGPANDMLQMVRARVPHEVLLGSTYVSAASLMYDGIVCIAVVAVCRTLITALNSLLLDRS